MENLYFVVEVKPWEADDEENQQAPGHKLYVNGVPYEDEADFLKEVRAAVIEDIQAMNMGDVSWDIKAVFEIDKDKHPLMVTVLEYLAKGGSNEQGGSGSAKGGNG